MRTINFKGIEFETIDEAIQETYASGRGEAILLAGRKFVVDKAEAERLETEGVEFAYLGLHELPNGRDVVVTIPVND